MAREKRRRVYIVPEHDIIACIEGRMKFEGIPEDAEVNSIYLMFDYNGWGIKMDSSEFDVVEEGQMLPIFMAEYQVVEKDNSLTKRFGGR